MIIGDDRERVIENIRFATECGVYHAKVETADPVLTPEQRKAVLERFAQKTEHRCSVPKHRLRAISPTERPASSIKGQGLSEWNTLKPFPEVRF